MKNTVQRCQRTKHSRIHPKLKGAEQEGGGQIFKMSRLEIFTLRQIRMTKPYTVRLVDHVAGITANTAAYAILPSKSEGKRRLGWHGLRWEDNIKTDLNWKGVCGLNSSHTGYESVEGSCEKKN
jgi:hypothetical protein